MEHQTSNELNKNLVVICVTVLLVCLLIGGAIVWRPVKPSGTVANAGNDTAGAQQQQAAPQPPAPAVDISKVSVKGNPFIGNVNAPVVIAFWSDYQCPFCKKAAQESMPQIITDYVNTGKAKIVFKDWAFLGDDSQKIAQFARAVWAADPAKFGVWHKAIFDNQGTENTGWATHDKLMSITTAAIGAADAKKASQLVAANGAEYQKAMDADRAEGTAFGINGTPGTVIGKLLLVGAQPYSAFKAAIDTVLAGK